MEGDVRERDNQFSRYDVKWPPGTLLDTQVSDLHCSTHSLMSVFSRKCWCKTGFLDSWIHTGTRLSMSSRPLSCAPGLRVPASFGIDFMRQFGSMSMTRAWPLRDAITRSDCLRFRFSCSLKTHRWLTRFLLDHRFNGEIASAGDLRASCSY